jgi:hypothetical protein
MGWTKKLTLASDKIRERCPEPGVEDAWKYVTGMQILTNYHIMHPKRF